jgi:16S rRNA (adenine1518-N6/adenine1519-N6)-dimethyltransferase
MAGTISGMNLSSPAAVSALLKQHRLQPRRGFGQNFLVDKNTLDKIVAAGGVGPGDCVLEVGAGLGVLTQALAGAAGESGSVVSVEVDNSLLPALATTVGGLPQVTIVQADVMKLDLAPFLDERFPRCLDRVKVVANIPYNITSPLLAALLAVKERFGVLVFLVQREVGQRLAAAPATPDYGAFSVFAQYHCRVEIVGIVSRRVFLPPPDVDSAIIRLTPHAEPPVSVSDESVLFAVVRAAFGQRRKSLINALSGDPSLGWTREHASAALAAAGIDPVRRGETLSLAEFARLADAGAAPPLPSANVP